MPITKMPIERYHLLMEAHEPELTEEERQEGWHFCPDWDLLLVGPFKDYEWGEDIKKCRCGYEHPYPENGWLEVC